MDSKADIGSTPLDTAKLLLASLIVLAGILGYYYFADESALLRAVGVLLALILAAWVAMQSYQGRLLWKFIQGSRIELRKVVWPTREETIQTTAIVLVLALIGGAFFWLLDLALVGITQWITG